MERENWTNSNFSITNELNCPTDQVGSCFLNPEWENSMDQSDPFESALSSMVSSPAASNAGGGLRGGGGGDGFVLGELIGRLGSICNSPQFNIKSNNNNNSTETSCYSTPLNSPPKLNLSMMMDQQQIRGNLPIPGNNPNFPPFSADPGFAERAARFSCFSSNSRNYGGYPNGQLGLNETEFPCRSTSGMESGKLSSVSSNHSLKIPGSQLSFEEKKDGFPSPIGNSNSDKKFNRLSMSPEEKTEEFGDSREESSVSEQNPGGEIGLKGQNVTNSRKRKSILKGKAKDLPPSPSPSVQDPKAGNEESNSKRSKADEATRGKEKMVECIEEEEGNQKAKKENAKPTPEPPKDYIHVRARRGQATDSHSLAERVRREKISERMKLLQDLVPGCNKVTGKAVMLDEIINYVQSLQRQVEFLSMKLATVNPRMDFTMDSLLSKDIFQSRLQTNYPLDSSASAFPFGYQSQGPSVQAAIHNGTETLFAMNPLNAALRRNSGVQLPPINGFNEASSQASAFWEDDLLTVVQMGFGQKEPQCLSGTMAAAQMKIEL